MAKYTEATKDDTALTQRKSRFGSSWSIRFAMLAILISIIGMVFAISLPITDFAMSSATSNLPTYPHHRQNMAVTPTFITPLARGVSLPVHTATPMTSPPSTLNRYTRKSSWCLSIHGWNLICTTRRSTGDNH